MGQISKVGAALDVAVVPALATAAIGGSGVVANAAAVATLPAKPTMTAYITGFQITGAGATAASAVAAQLAGIVGGPIAFAFTFPAGAGVAASPLVVTFPVAIPAAAMNTAITLTLPAAGAGNLAACVTIEGFYL
jgi:hypothetical protein